jgi:hypothetical protein
MSKKIDFTQPLSEEDAAWAAQFHGLHGGMIAANREQFPQQAGSDLSGEEVSVPPYAEWTKADLVDEAKRRNNEEGTSLKTSGTVAELAKQLEDDDAAA